MKAKSADFLELEEWPWYVDDSILKCKRNRSEEILNHLNQQEPGIIKFTKEEEVDNKMAVLDLGLNVNRKRKKIEFNVHYKATHTNITIKKKSNHRSCTKKGVMKGYADRARALCDPQYLEEELVNIEEVFMSNGYSRREVKEAMQERPPPQIDDDDEEEEEENNCRGIVSIPNVPTFTRAFSRIARQHNFRSTSKAVNKVKDLSSKAKTPLGDKNMNVVYKIPCGCEEHSYTGHTDRKWGSRKKEHMDKVKLTQRDIQNGNIESANERMNTGDGGLAKHNSVCEHPIMWDQARIVRKEQKLDQRKYLEGIMSLKEKSKGIIPLNAYNQMEPWQPTIYAFLDI